MQLLQSIFCSQGFDNRRRFFIISFVVYLCFIIFSAALSANLIFSIIILLVLVALNILTTLRRLHDATLNKNWLLAPVSFAIVGLVVILTAHASSYWLLILPILSSALLLTYPSKSARTYILGYSGPVDLSQYQQTESINKNQRIEPTFLGGDQLESTATGYSTSKTETANDIHVSNHQTTFEKHAQNNENQPDIGEIIRLKLFSHKNARITFISIISIVVIAISVSLITSTMHENIEGEGEVVKAPVTQKIIRLEKLDMPDKFSLYQSEFNGIIIYWQADTITDTELWSQQTAQGDKSCKEISFNKGKPIRTQTVLVENQENYYANFSPLDSEELIQALAFRGNFSLCGYKFSLKGSQAALSKNAHYSDLLSY